MKAGFVITDVHSIVWYILHNFLVTLQEPYFPYYFSKIDQMSKYLILCLCRYEQVYKFRNYGYSVDYLVDFSVTTDLKNSSWRILDLDQPSLGMNREYLIKGFDDEDVQVRAYLL